MNAWSQPDAEGVRTRELDAGARSTLKARRLRRGDTPRSDLLGTFPAEWRELLAQWFKGSASRRTWRSMLKAAGPNRATAAHQLLEALLKGGFVELDERRDRAGIWRIQWVTFLHTPALYHVLGLPDPDKTQREYERLAALELNDGRLAVARVALAVAAPAVAVRRLALLEALDRWIEEGRFGTERDFAFFACGDTKGINPTDWSWLRAQLDLASLGIERHTPALWLRGPVSLTGRSGRLDLRLVPDAIGLTPETVEAVVGGDGHVGVWRILENRTSFEQAARAHGGNDLVAWLPGFAPDWWFEGVGHLLDLFSLPAFIACDPDPAGIRIALRAGRLWERRGLAWHPWRMSAEDLESLPARRPLTDHDRQQLEAISQDGLPLELAGLVASLLERGEKGEQEGLSFFEP